MAISSVGIGSGLDVESIVTQLVTLEKQPIKTLEAKAELIQSKISTYGQIKSLTDELNAAVRDLTLDRTWNTVKINSSNSSAVNATMTGSAAAGSYSIQVQELAQAQTAVSTKFGSSEKMDVAGVMRFEVGNPDSSVANAVKTYDLNISANDKLEDIVSKINTHTDLSKTVVASIITDSTGKQQLMVRSRETGTDSQFTVGFGASVNTAGALEPTVSGGLHKMAAAAVSDDLATTADEAVPAGFRITQEAKNAQIKLNGVELESTSNSFANVIPGLSISVSAKDTTSLLTLTQDKDAVQTSIQKFVDAYNALNDMLGSSTKYDQETGVAGVLQGDSSTVSLQNALRMLTQGVASQAAGAFNRLSDAGIQMLQGGKLSVNATKLATALGDMDSLKSMFAAKADPLGKGGGIAVSFKAFTDELLAYEGTLNGKTDSLEDQLKRNKTEVERVETRAETVEARLRKQYSALDVKMASLSSLSSYVEQMVASWNKSSD